MLDGCTIALFPISNELGLGLDSHAGRDTFLHWLGFGNRRGVFIISFVELVIINTTGAAKATTKDRCRQRDNAGNDNAYNDGNIGSATICRLTTTKFFGELIHTKGLVLFLCQEAAFRVDIIYYSRSQIDRRKARQHIGRRDLNRSAPTSDAQSHCRWAKNKA